MRSRPLLKNGAIVNANVNRIGRNKLVVRYKPAYTAKNFGHWPGSIGVKPVCLTTVSQAMVTRTPALRLEIMP